MSKIFKIDALPERALAYRAPTAVVAVDAFRATTTILTALAAGRRVYPVASLIDGERVARTLTAPLLAGELAGNRPDGFDLNNSPAEIEQRPDRRPLVLLSSAGTLLLANAHGAAATYVACFRNLTAAADHVGQHHDQVAIIGAGARGAPRPEDEMVCAWIGDRLISHGFSPADAHTEMEVSRWRGASIDLIRQSPSAEYLRSTGQERDIDFVVAHLDDLQLVATFDGDEATLVSQPRARLEGRV
jgi:2-phosphosulfolactate phosphatase